MLDNTFFWRFLNFRDLNPIRTRYPLRRLPTTIGRSPAIQPLCEEQKLTRMIRQVKLNGPTTNLT